MNSLTIITIIIVVVILILCFITIFNKFKLSGSGVAYEVYVKNLRKPHTPFTHIIHYQTNNLVEWKLHIAYPKDVNNIKNVINDIENIIKLFSDKHNTNIGWKITEHIKYDDKNDDIEKFYISSNQILYSMTKEPIYNCMSNICWLYYNIKKNIGKIYYADKINFDNNVITITSSNGHIEYTERIEIIPNEVDFTNIHECPFEIKKNYCNTIKDNINEYYEKMKNKYTSIVNEYFENIHNLIKTKSINKCEPYTSIFPKFENTIKACKDFVNFYRNEFKYRNDIDKLANSIELNKFITIYCDEKFINDLAEKIHEKFEKSKYDFYNMYTEYYIYPGIYTRLSETQTIENNKECLINRYTPAIFKSTFDYYLKDHENIVHPFDNDLWYNDIKLPKNINEINSKLPKELLYDCGCEYLN